MPGPCSFDFEDFDALRRMIRAGSGIWLADTKQRFLEVRLAERLIARNISSAREYYHFLKYDPAGQDELQQLIDAVTINETWFYREPELIEAWVKDRLPALLASVEGPVRVWSAGCATGEEPYTVAMMLWSAYPEWAAAGRFEIVGADISRRALLVGRAGHYDPYSLRHMPPTVRDRFFTPAPTGRFVLREDIRRMVRFEPGNLLDAGLVARLGLMDLVLCRNVVIYFDTAGRRALLENVHRALRPGAYLLLGLSEAMGQPTLPFEAARLNGAIVFRRQTLPPSWKRDRQADRSNVEPEV